jgi:hypothetical protein
MGDAKPFIRENPSAISDIELKSVTDNQRNPDIIPKDANNRNNNADTTVAEPVTTEKTEVLEDAYTKYGIPAYGTVANCRRVAYQEDALGTFIFYRPVDVSVRMIERYDRAMKDAGFEGGLFDRIITATDVYLERSSATYMKNFGNNQGLIVSASFFEISAREKYFIINIIVTDRQLIEPKIDYEKLVEISNLSVTDGEVKHGYTEYWITASMTNNADVGRYIMFSIDIFSNGRKIKDVLMFENVPAGETMEKTIFSMDLQNRSYDELRFQAGSLFVSERQFQQR